MQAVSESWFRAAPVRLANLTFALLPEAPARPFDKPATFIGPKSNIQTCRTSVIDIED